MEPIEFTLTKADLTDAQRLHQMLALRGPRGLVLVGFLILWLVYIVMVAPPIDGHGVLVNALVALAGAVAFIGLMILVGRYISLPIVARRQLSQQKELQAPLKFQVQPPVIAITTKNSFINLPTEDLRKWAENRRVILLYRSDRLFNIVPKRFVTPAFEAALKAELKRAGVRKFGP